jgi:hypothetical protein
VDVDGELFPYLCKEVPLIVLRLKNRKQEPVKGGVAGWPARLPVGTNPGKSRQQTVLGAVFHRIRRIALALAFALVVAVVFTELFLYHLAVDQEGFVVVRRGIRPLAALLPGKAGLRVQTELSEQDFDPNSDRLGSLRGASIVGVWRHQSEIGYRQWLDSVLPALREPVRARTTFEVTGRLSSQVLSDSSHLFEGWRVVLTAESLLTDAENPERRTAWLAHSVPKLSAVDAQTGVVRTNVLDFTILKLSTEEVLRLHASAAVWATVDPEAVFPVFLDLIRIVCYRAAHSLTEQDALAEARGLVGVLRSIGAARVARGQPALSAADRKTLSEEGGRLERFAKGRQLWVIAPMAGLGALIDQRETQAALLGYVGTFDPDKQGSLLNFQQHLALDALAQSGAGRQLDPEVFSKLIDLSKNFQEGLLSVPEFEKFLLQVAPRQPLPPRVRAKLWDFVRAGPGLLDRNPLISLRILAAGAERLPEDERKKLVDSAVMIDPSMARMKYVAELYGLLGTHDLATDQMIEGLNRALVLDRPRRNGAPPTELPALVVVGGDDAPAAIALGQIARKRLLPVGIGDRLYEWAAERRSLHGRSDLMEGLAEQRRRSTGKHVLNFTTIRAHTAECSRDAGRRSLEVQIGIQQFLAIGRAERLGILTDLWNGHNIEEEVEVRQALHRVWLGTRQVMDLKDAGVQ